ncbi:hypothetical protein BKA65DRAFT_267611 [Rhexocercosporidium sp. MPI-PUGE-AT-0058]|nr:hypothetical protein BKA65DRAFT_267611 [Rhexocercosporidium sp. MPI-PUGE-AT-0058]
MSQQVDDLEPRFSCNFDECTKSFSREADAVRHEKETHGPRKHCPVEGCPWIGAKRQERVTKHMESKHRERIFAHLSVPEDGTWMDTPLVDLSSDQNQAAFDRQQSYGSTSAHVHNHVAQDLAQPTYGTGSSYTSSSNQTHANQRTEWRDHHPSSQLNGSDVDTAEYGEHLSQEQSAVLSDENQYQEECTEDEVKWGYDRHSKH